MTASSRDFQFVRDPKACKTKAILEFSLKRSLVVAEDRPRRPPGTFIVFETRKHTKLKREIKAISDFFLKRSLVVAQIRSRRPPGRLS